MFEEVEDMRDRFEDDIEDQLKLWELLCEDDLGDWKLLLLNYLAKIPFFGTWPNRELNKKITIMYEVCTALSNTLND